jgi:MEDS: MEthanogen/methylotroph, DcmR Sensory domain
MATARSTHHHAVQFYSSDKTLFTTVATFLAEGMVAGQPAIVIATPAHRAAIVEHLCGKSIDCDRAIRDGNLLLLDAQETLDLFMIDDEPHATVFFDNVGRLIDQALNGRKSAYGEMVDVLWRAGKPESAIKL